MMCGNQTTASVAKKGRSACARCGTFFFFFHMTGVDNYLHFTIRCVEALTRAGEVDRRLLPKAVNMFEVRS